MILSALMKWLLPILTVIVIFSFIFIGAKSVVDSTNKIASAAEIVPTEAMPTPTPTPSEKALNLVAYAMERETDTAKAKLKTQYGNKDMTDTELITAIALSADANPAQMASLEAYKEKETVAENRPVYYQQTVDNSQNDSQTQQKLEDIQQQQQQIENQQQDAEERDRMNCMDNGGLYSSVSGCNY